LVRTPASLRHQPATSEIYTLSLHDALPICSLDGHHRTLIKRRLGLQVLNDDQPTLPAQPNPVVHLKPGGKLSESRDGQCSALARSEEHTSELQSRENLVCRLLLEKKNTQSD